MGRRLAAVAVALVLLGLPATLRAECGAWPGEPSPLPTSTHPDGALARWAQLRSLELRAMAERTAADPVTVDRLLRHADCLSPLRDPPPEAPVPRSRLAVRIHRPGLAVAEGVLPEVQESESIGAALAHLGEPLRIASRAAPPPRTPQIQPPPTRSEGVVVAPVVKQIPDAVAVAPAVKPIPDAVAVAPAVKPIPDSVAAERSLEPVAEAPEPLVEPAAEEPLESAGSKAAPLPVSAEGAFDSDEAASAEEAVDREEAVAAEEGSRELPAVSAPPPLQLIAESWVEDAEASLAAARFEETLERAAEARAALESVADADSRRTQAKLEILGGTAALALGREEQAARHFARARSLDPGLALDPARHSPKVIRAFSVSEPVP
jgi:hypothetical protein